MPVRSSGGSALHTRTVYSTPRRSTRSLKRIERSRRIDMRHVLASAALTLLGAARSLAPQEVTIDWSRTVVTGGVVQPGAAPGGAPALELRATTWGPTSLHLVTIDHPPAAGPAYVVAGEVRYEGVEGQGYLEMWSERRPALLLVSLAVPPRPLRLGLLPVGERRRRQPEVVFGCLQHPLGILAAALLERLAPHPLRELERLVAGRIEPPRRRVLLSQHLHHVLERHRHVTLHVRIGQVPARVLENHLKRPAPALALGEMHHAAEQPPAGAHAEQRG